MIQELQKTADAAVDQPYDRAADLIMRTAGRICCSAGGSAVSVAAMLGGYLLQFRPDIRPRRATDSPRATMSSWIWARATR